MGGLRGGYDAGVVATLCRKLGPDYFDGVFASSVGVFAATFFVANQPDTIENTWRNLVDGKKLVSLLHPLRRREILDLDYLIEIFQNEGSRLDIEGVLNSRTSLVYVLTEYPSGNVTYRAPSRENLFELMRASAALPLAHRPVRVGGVCYTDGGLVQPLPIAKALEGGYEEIIAIYNKPEEFYVGWRFKLFLPLLSLGLPSAISQLVRTFETRVRELERKISSDPRISVIRPREQIPLRSILDTNRSRLNETIDLGVADARRFVASQLPNRQS